MAGQAKKTAVSRMKGEGCQGVAWIRLRLPDGGWAATRPPLPELDETRGSDADRRPPREVYSSRSAPIIRSITETHLAYLSSLRVACDLRTPRALLGERGVHHQSVRRPGRHRNGRRLRQPDRPVHERRDRLHQRRPPDQRPGVAPGHRDLRYRGDRVSQHRHGRRRCGLSRVRATAPTSS